MAVDLFQKIQVDAGYQGPPSGQISANSANPARRNNEKTTILPLFLGGHISDFPRGNHVA